MGRVVRSDEREAAVRIDRYEFKTRRGQGLTAAVAVSTGS
jgi:hypothetical protein